MWEIIRKNKIKSIIAFCIMATWYSIIYGAICATLLIMIIGGIYSEIFDNLNNNSFIALFMIGVLIALIVFYVEFITTSDEPYQFNLCRMYKADKAKNKQLYNIVEEIAIASGIKHIPKIHILDSNILNAYACGINKKNSSIVVSKKLLELLSRDELQGVIAHEMSHIINKDTTYLFCSGALYVTTAGFTLFFKESARGRGKDAPLMLILFLISLLGQGICFLLFMFISRKREYLADACACTYTRYPKGLADALLKINGKTNNTIKSNDKLINASCIVPLKEKDGLLSTHPSTQNRIKVLMNMTSADYAEYEKEFQALNSKNLIPKNTVNNSKKIKIKEVQTTSIDPNVIAICALNSTIESKEEIETIKNNKELLSQNIQKRREVDDMVRDLANYTIINCECSTKLKIPPVYKNQIVICPHCKKKHAIK